MLVTTRSVTTNSDTQPVGFTTSTYTYSGTSRTGQYALSLPASTAMSRTISKNAQAGKYVFSIWVNSASAGTLTVSLSSGGTTNSDTISYVAASGKWIYYEKQLSLSGLSSSFTAQFQSSTAIIIDDVFFYPDVAEVTANAYDPTTFQKTAQTNTNGVSNYFTYDSFNRPRLVYDQDKNIISKKSYYLNSAQYPSLGTLAVNASSSTPVVNTSDSFSVPGIPDCLQDQVTITWNFGDGSATVSGNFTPSHTYTSTGSKTVTATVSSLFFATQTLTYYITVASPPPVLIPVYYTNNLSDSNRGKITTVTFTGTSHTYTFTESDLLSGQNIYQDNYSISFTVGVVHGPPLWNSLDFGVACWPRSSGASGSLSIDLSSSTVLNLSLNTSNCVF